MKICFVALCILFGNAVSAQPTQRCEAVLRPNLETTARNYRVMQAYMSLNAANEYERLHNMTDSQRHADATYKVFHGEYEDSDSSSSFQEKVSNRLTTEGFREESSGAMSEYRETISREQIAAWATCVSREGGGVLASGSQIDYEHKQFVLSVDWEPQRALGEAILDIEIVNGKIDGRSRLSEKRVGRGGKSYNVVATSSAKTATAIVNIAGSDDKVMISFVKPPPPPPVKPGDLLQAGTFEVRESQSCNPGDSDVLQCAWGGGAIKPKSKNSVITAAVSILSDITVVPNATGGCTDNIQTTDPWRRGEINFRCGDNSPVRTTTNWVGQARHLAIQSQSYELRERCEANGQQVQITVFANPRGCSIMTSKKPSFIRWEERQK